MSKIRYDGGLTCALTVKDLDASLEWYQEVLGFRLLYRSGNWCELGTDVDGVTVGLSQSSQEIADGGAVLTFGVFDVESVRQSLEKSSVTVEGDIQVIQNLAKLLSFRDPSGNKLMFYEDVRPRKQ
ncbi:VOC family protein [Haliangium ochraceum]|uniref:Glyoxalase/bleomycin resistance protein/dioxygenase n=1 Tax=Haliangium ochraceum (strain DSM 14365 / JCM 11303 / SMP-2) TaxID=502025 RepID=D0LMV6_HALO1|nr:VOC family protein [Haliangium ochraceum]ACY13327.1 Glyoxalase/bleomycin resistance protein/dioxygenase [Haliangium ochraceum DSM 14365]